MWFLGSCHIEIGQTQWLTHWIFFGNIYRKPSILPGKIWGFPLQIVSHQSSEYHLAPLVTNPPSLFAVGDGARLRSTHGKSELPTLPDRSQRPGTESMTWSHWDIMGKWLMYVNVIWDIYIGIWLWINTYLWWLMVATKGNKSLRMANQCW